MPSAHRLKAAQSDVQAGTGVRGGTVKCEATIEVYGTEYRCTRPVSTSATGAIPIPHQNHEWRRGLTVRGNLTDVAITIEWVAGASGRKG